jgi:hypothetical protein
LFFAEHWKVPLDFLPAHRNIVLVAAQGLSKTMIAKNIVHHAVLAGGAALFITASDLLLSCSTSASRKALAPSNAASATTPGSRCS